MIHAIKLFQTVSILLALPILFQSCKTYHNGSTTLNYDTKKQPRRVKIYRTWVSLKNEPFIIKGILSEVKDSSIVVSSPILVRDSYVISKSDFIDIHFSDIDIIKVRRKGEIPRSMLSGAIVGFVGSSVYGYAVAAGWNTVE